MARDGVFLDLVPVEIGSPCPRQLPGFAPQPSASVVNDIGYPQAAGAKIFPGLHFLISAHHGLRKGRTFGCEPEASSLDKPGGKSNCGGMTIQWILFRPPANRPVPGRLGMTDLQKDLR